MVHVTSPTFVGRAAELEALDVALMAAIGGQASTVLIGGDPGVGKTRLLRTWNERTVKRGVRIATGSCLDLGETGPAYAAIIEALRELFRDLDARDEEGLVGPDRSVLARIVPELGPAPDPDVAAMSPSTLGRTRLFERLVDLLRRASTTAPVVLELEDIHWADQSTQAFLLYLVGAAKDANLLLLCTYRPEAADTNEAFRTTLGQLLRREGVATLPLEPFDEDELRAQLTGILGRAPSTALLNAIHARSEGNPLFTEELAAARDPRVDLPTSVGAATATRVRSLSPNARSVLRVASVVGRVATYDVLREVTSLSDDDLAEALREAVRVRLLEPIHVGEAYRFRHALLQEAIYQETLPGERRRLHAAIALALSEDPDHPPDDADLAPRLARHWLEGREYPRAFAASTAAAAAAERQSAYAQALTHYERLIELWDRAGQATAGLTRAGVLERAAWMAFLSGELERSAAHGRSALSELATTPDQGIQIRVMDRFALTLERLGQDYWPVSRRIAETDPEGRSLDDRIRIDLHRAQCLQYDGQPEVALELARGALELAGSASDVYLYADSADVVAQIQQMFDVDDAIRVLESACELAISAGDDVVVADKRAVIVGILERHCRSDDVISRAPDVIEFVGRVGLGPSARPYLRYLKAKSHLRLGQLGDGIAEIEPAMADAPTGTQLALVQRVAAQGCIATGAFDEAAMHLEAARYPGEGPEEEQRRGNFAAIRASLALAERRWEDAEAIVEATAPRIAAEPMYDQNSETMWPLVEVGLGAVAERVEYSRATGDAAPLAEIGRVVERLTGYLESVRRQREHMGFPDLGEMKGYEALIAGQLGRIEGRDAPNMWETAAAEFPPRSIEALTARYRQAEAMLATRISRDDVRRLVAAANEIAIEIGARPLAERFEALARRARIDLRTTAGDLGESGATELPDDAEAGSSAHAALRNRGLSDREIEVLALVASGWSNGQIADRLFISAKTVSVHVTHILDKLGAATRIEAATLAVRLGLPEVGYEDP